MENPKGSAKKQLELIWKFSKADRHNKTAAVLYACNEIPEQEIRITSPITIALKTLK